MGVFVVVVGLVWFVCMCVSAFLLSLAFGIIICRIFQIYLLHFESETHIKRKKEYSLPCSYNPHVIVSKDIKCVCQKESYTFMFASAVAKTTTNRLKSQQEMFQVIIKALLTKHYIARSVSSQIAIFSFLDFVSSRLYKYLK